MAVFLLLTAFLVIWLTTGFAIEAIEKLSHHTRLTRFTLSLFVLGTVTSLPEIAVTLNAIAVRAPQVSLGNLIGSQIVLLFLVIPVLAIVSGGLHLKVQMKNVSLVFALLVTLVPMVALLNQNLELSEGIFILGVYLVFVFMFTRQNNILDRVAERIHLPTKIFTVGEVVKLGLAIGVLLLASNTAVRQIIELSAILQTPRFLLSLILLPIGTNLPELSLALGSLTRGKKDLALGDYMGALTFNSLLIGLLMFGAGGSIYIGQNIVVIIGLFLIGLVVFWWCCFSKEVLSVKEGLLLLFCYSILLVAALWQSLGSSF